MSPTDSVAGDEEEGRKARPDLVEGQLPQGAAVPTDDLLGEAFSYAAFTANRFIVDHMLRFSRHFGLDYETMVIWAVLANQNVAHLMPLRGLPDRRIDAYGQSVDVGTSMKPVRIRDLTQITGIPKETVRRKLDLLVRDGWIRRMGAGWVMCHERIHPDLEDFTEELVKRLLAAADHIGRILHDNKR